MRGHGPGHTSSMDETLALLAQSELNTLLKVLANRVQQQSAAGIVVAAGGAITPDASLTIVPPPGGGNANVRISANASFTSGAGTVTPFLQVASNGGAFSNAVAWAQTTDQQGDISMTFVEVSLPPSVTSLQVHWQTTAGDAAATLGHSNVGGGVGATLLLEQVP